ncbi:MAG: hypothetical protein ACT4OF_11510 [Caulobacteraceae bacterium]
MLRILAAAFVFAAFAGRAAAQTEPESPLAPVFACSDIANDQDRLACFDRVVREVRQATSDGRLVTVDRAQAETLRRESFGLSLPSVFSLFSRSEDADSALDEISYSVEEIVTYADGRHTFVMSNGQRWAQVEPDRTRNVRTGDEVTVRRAALGSYMLVGSRGGQGHRVRRVN